MKDRKNSKGFTLIELLAVLVILTAIMGIAIPTISSSLERNKKKQDDSKIKILENAAELYVSDYKNAIYKNGMDQCCISFSVLVEKNLVSSDAILDSSNHSIPGSIVFDKSEAKYEYKKSVSCTNTSTIKSCL